MYGDNSSTMPIGLAMSLSSNPEAFYKFLKMSDSEQDKIMKEASKANSFLQIHNIVKGIELK